jgi:hypothetical protein
MLDLQARDINLLTTSQAIGITWMISIRRIEVRMYAAHAAEIVCCSARPKSVTRQNIFTEDQCKIPNLGIGVIPTAPDAVRAVAGERDGRLHPHFKHHTRAMAFADHG